MPDFYCPERNLDVSGADCLRSYRLSVLTSKGPCRNCARGQKINKTDQNGLKETSTAMPTLAKDQQLLGKLAAAIRQLRGSALDDNASIPVKYIRNAMNALDGTTDADCVTSVQLGALTNKLRLTKTKRDGLTYLVLDHNVDNFLADHQTYTPPQSEPTALESDVSCAVSPPPAEEDSTTALQSGALDEIIKNGFELYEPYAAIQLDNMPPHISVSNSNLTFSRVARQNYSLNRFSACRVLWNSRSAQLLIICLPDKEQPSDLTLSGSRKKTACISAKGLLKAFGITARGRFRLQELRDGVYMATLAKTKTEAA